MIPILLNHNPNEIIGILENGIGVFNDEFVITRDKLFDIFGNCGYRILEQVEVNEEMRIKKFQILEWSLTNE